MTEFTITTNEREVKFFHTADDEAGKTSYLWCDLNGKEGTLGQQCMKLMRGHSAMTAIEVTEKNARRQAREWLKAEFADDENF